MNVARAEVGELKVAAEIDVNAFEPTALRPVGHWILAEAIPKQNKSKGGILLSDSTDTEAAYWLVHDVGEGLVSGATGDYLPNSMHGITRGDVLMSGSRGWGVAIKETREFVTLKIPDITGVYDGAGLA